MGSGGGAPKATLWAPTRWQNGFLNFMQIEEREGHQQGQTNMSLKWRTQRNKSSSSSGTGPKSGVGLLLAVIPQCRAACHMYPTTALLPTLRVSWARYSAPPQAPCVGICVELLSFFFSLKTTGQRHGSHNYYHGVMRNGKKGYSSVRLGASPDSTLSLGLGRTQASLGLNFYICK